MAAASYVSGAVCVVSVMTLRNVSLLHGPEHSLQDLEHRLYARNRVVAHVANTKGRLAQWRLAAAKLKTLLAHAPQHFHVASPWRANARYRRGTMLGGASDEGHAERCRFGARHPRGAHRRHRRMPRVTGIERFQLDVGELTIEREQQRHRGRSRALRFRRGFLVTQDVEIHAAVLYGFRALDKSLRHGGEREPRRER